MAATMDAKKIAKSKGKPPKATANKVAKSKGDPPNTKEVEAMTTVQPQPKKRGRPPKATNGTSDLPKMKKAMKEKKPPKTPEKDDLEGMVVGAGTGTNPEHAHGFNSVVYKKNGRIRLMHMSTCASCGAEAYLDVAVGECTAP